MTSQQYFGRLEAPDDRDKRFLLSQVVPRTTARQWRYWHQNAWWGNQGATPHCVAYAWMHLAEDGPITIPATKPLSHRSLFDTTWLYNECQLVDEWPGNDYDGTSVRAGAKILKREGVLAEYRWAWDLDTTVRALLEAGPVIVGTHWFDGMLEPDKQGFLNPSGPSVGGHAYVLNGVNVTEEKVRVKNSWGRRWGHKGTAWLSFDALKYLIHLDGEVCLPVQRMGR